MLKKRVLPFPVILLIRCALSFDPNPPVSTQSNGFSFFVKIFRHSSSPQWVSPEPQSGWTQVQDGVDEIRHLDQGQGHTRSQKSRHSSQLWSYQVNLLIVPTTHPSMAGVVRDPDNRWCMERKKRVSGSLVRNKSCWEGVETGFEEVKKEVQNLNDFFKVVLTWRDYPRPRRKNRLSRLGSSRGP